MKFNKTTRRRFIKILGLSSIGAMIGGILINKEAPLAQLVRAWYL